MIKYDLKESQNGSLFVVTSKKGNLYGLSFEKKDIEVQDFDDDFLQENMLEVLMVKFTTNESTQIKYVVETCHEIFYEVVNGKFKDRIIFLSCENGSPRSKLVERLILKKPVKNIVYLRIKDVSGQSFYFVFNEEYISTMQVINCLIDYFKKEYDISLSYTAKDKNGKEKGKAK